MSKRSFLVYTSFFHKKCRHFGLKRDNNMRFFAIIFSWQFWEIKSNIFTSFGAFIGPQRAQTLNVTPQTIWNTWSGSYVPTWHHFWLYWGNFSYHSPQISKKSKKILNFGQLDPSPKKWPKSLYHGLMYMYMYDMFTNNISGKHYYFNISIIYQ